MSINYKSLNTDLINVLYSFGLEIEKRDGDGQITSEIADTEYFSSNEPDIYLVVDPEESQVRLSVDANTDIADTLRAKIKDITQDYNLNMDFKLIGKNRTPNTEGQEKQMSEVNELRKLAGLPEQDPVAETEQLDEIAPLIGGILAGLGTVARFAGPRALSGLRQIADVAKTAVTSQTTQNAAKAVAKGTGGVAKWSVKNPVKSTVAGVAATNPQATMDFVGGAADMAGAAGDAISGTADAVKGAADSVSAGVQMASGALDSVEGYAAQIAGVAKQVGAAITDNSALMKIATIAKTYALPIGLVLAAIWGGKKILSAIFDDVQHDDSKMVESEENVMEGFGSMTGSSKTSYQGLDNVKLIVKHKAPVNEESRGARSRNIHSIFVQRGEERFKMSENNLKAARAMARHLQMGGETFDSVGTAITEMAAEQRKLSEFARYVTKRGLVNETNQEFVTIAKENVANIKSTLDKLCGVKSYANAVESLQDMANVEILEDDLDLEAKFTETHFDNKVADAMDSLKRSMSRRNSFESAIRTAIQKESFANLKDMLNETGVVDFASPQARLSHQVSQMGYAAQNPMLRNHLMGISKKIDAGQGLGQFEYDTIKSCLLSASEARVQEGNMYESAQQDWENFLEQYDIL
jgi:hypothetical protein